MKPTVKEQKEKKGRLWIYSKSELLIKLKNILSNSSLRFKNNRPMDPQNLAVFLYKINFLTARKTTPYGIERIYYDENRYIQNEYTDFGYEFEVHMAYRWALQPSSKDDDILDTYDL